MHVPLIVRTAATPMVKRLAKLLVSRGVRTPNRNRLGITRLNYTPTMPIGPSLALPLYDTVSEHRLAKWARETSYRQS